MLIAVEATRLEREVRGIGRYVRAILPRLVTQRPDLRLVLFAKTRRGVSSLTAQLSRDPLLRDRVTVRHIRHMARTRADVHWFPWNVVRPVPRHGAIVATVHDIAPVAHPDPRWTAWRKNLRWRVRFTRTGRVAALLLADSAFTASEIERVLGVSASRIRVAPLAADDMIVAPTGAGDTAALERLGVRAPYVLAVGAAERRKNHAVLERAMRSVVARHANATLVLAGPRRHAEPPSPLAPWTRTLGFVSDSDLEALYRNAVALAMPSTYEGFGLPVLEAMRLGTPVICARASSLPEVAGDAALWVSPDDDAALAQAILRVLESDALRASMRADGLRQAAAFTWDETARKTLLAFEEASALHERSASPAIAAALQATSQAG